MPVPKKKRITAEKALSTSEPASPLLPEQQAFHQHLRALARIAVRTVLELVMREELDAFIGAAVWVTNLVTGSVYQHRSARMRHTHPDERGVLGPCASDAQRGPGPS
jgi:hypothetical protein